MGKSVHVQQESLFTFDRNGCSRWAGIGVQLAREYALGVNGPYSLPAVRWRQLNLDKAGPGTREAIVHDLKAILAVA